MSKEETIEVLAKDILERLPDDFNVEEVMLKYPTMYEESMNTVLVQEMIRYNRLTQIIRPSLVNVRKALKGLVVLNDSLDEVCTSFFDGKVPQLWMGKSFPSLKPLAGYVTDMLARLNFFDKWYKEGPPAVFWFSGFFFPPAFVTGALQNFARRNQFAIDTVDLDFVVHNERPTEKPELGVYIDGLFAEAFRWDAKNNELATQLPKQLLAQVPTIHFVTMLTAEIKKIHGEDVIKTGEPHYKCPVYKTSVRKGTLATTGHSTNFVLPIRMPSSQPQSFWIKRGAAMLTLTDD